MKTLIVIMLTGLLGTTALNSPPLREGPGKGAEPIEPADQAVIPNAPTFTTIDITIDPQGQPLGAFQIELIAVDSSFLIAGVASGDHPAFDHGRPPYYDPVAIQGDSDRLILAEYALPQLNADQLPTQPIVVAQITIMVEPGVEPQPKLTLTAAGNADGERIEAQISHTFRTPERP